MKILVTGGAGYIGGTVTRLLLAGGHSATVFDNLCHSKRLAVANGAEFVEGDLADRALVEQMVAWRNLSHGLRYASLRYFNVAGAIEGYGEAHEPESHLIPLILDVALGRRASIKIFGRDYPTKDGTCVRDYIHVRDLAEAHLLALGALSEAKSRLIYNIGNGQ